MLQIRNMKLIIITLAYWHLPIPEIISEIIASAFSFRDQLPLKCMIYCI